MILVTMRRQKRITLQYKQLQPDLLANASTTDICSGESVNLSMTGTFSATYWWEVDESQIATEASTTVSPTSTTTYCSLL